MSVNNTPASLKCILSDANRDIYHVFLIGSPITAMTARMAIESFKIPPNRVICISIRNSATSLVCNDHVALKTLWHDRVIQKIFGKNTSGARLRRIVNRKCERFVVYTPWLFAEAECLSSSPRCLGHIYIEEGQLSYYNAATFPADKGFPFQFRQHQKSLGSVNHHYRDDGLAFIGILPDAYPSMPKDKRIILQNYADALKSYKPLLKGVFNIGILPAPHRTPFASLPSAINLMVSKMPDGGTIKLHPGYKLYPAHTKSVLKIVDEQQCRNVTICDDRAILELEMLVEKKQLFGARSSLSKYADSFGSSYKLVEFSGYMPPKN